MNERIAEDAARISLGVNEEITLRAVGSCDEMRTFRILEELGSGGTAIAYKVQFDGSDSNRYLYVLKEIYPIPVSGDPAIERRGKSLDIDRYDEKVRASRRYKIYREQFEAAYRIQNEMAGGEDAVLNMTTSLPLGLYEDPASGKNGVLALYGLFQYLVGHTLRKHRESSLTELISIQSQIAEAVKNYHNSGYLWLDIKEANVNVVGAGTVQSVSMFDFGSVVSREKLMHYKADTEPDFVLSFSTNPADLLLPMELRAMLFGGCHNGFGVVDSWKHEINIQALGESGAQTDIFLLGSLLFKRLTGRAPTETDCSDLQSGAFDLSAAVMLKGYPDKISQKLKDVLKKCLNDKNRNQRYPSVSAYMTDLKDVYLDLCTHEGLQLVEGNARKYVNSCCNRYLKEILTGDTNGKFRHLKKLQGRFESRVSLRSDQNNRHVLPSEAIDNAPPSGGAENRLVFLYGDGGMGKSTALYDYMREAASVTAIYIELSQYRFTDRDTSFVFRKIFEDICGKFIDAAGFPEDKELSVTENILLESLRTPGTDDTRPEYVLLLDGYNEISRDQRGGFDVEIANIIDTWKNCRIVITGRNLPADFEGKEIPVYEAFSKYEFVGISEEERRSLIAEQFPERVEVIEHDKRLWDVLKIPMFMGMFLRLHVDISVSVHTRGEILDQFITNTEKTAAEQIAQGQTGNRDQSALRKFIVYFSLPFAANAMDANRLFSADKSFISKQIALGNHLYLVKRVGACRASVYECVTSDFLTKDAVGFDDERFEFRQMKMMKESAADYSADALEKLAMADMLSLDQILHILSAETGYCYKTKNGKYEFTHQYFRDYFAAKHIQNILNTAQALAAQGVTADEQLQFTKDYGLDYTWSDDVCILLGEIIGDYKNEPGYSEE